VSPSGIHTVLVFPHQTLWQYYNGDPQTGEKIGIFNQLSSFNAIFGRVGHTASEAVIVELANSKCLPTLLYGLEACPLKSADLKSLDYTVVGAFMKIFKTKSKEVASCCMEMFNSCRLLLLTIENVNFCKNFRLLRT